MGASQRRKGHNYEREIAREYRKRGLDAKRGQQSRDGNEDSDVVSPGLSIECKCRAKCPNVFDAMAQAIEGVKTDETPIVHVRVDRRGDLVVLRLEDWFEFLESKRCKDDGGCCVSRSGRTRTTPRERR